MSTWRSYDAATSEDAYLEPLYLCTECGSRKQEAFKACEKCGNKEAERFVFPASVPMDFGLEFYRLAAEHDGKIPTVDLIPLFPQLFGRKRYERLQELGKSTGQTQAIVSGVFDDLLRAYGFVTEEVDDPLGAEEKTGKASRKRSSRTSDSSKPSSNATTGAKTSTPRGKSRAGAGSSTASKP